MTSGISHFPTDALSADRSNHGLWTAPQANCDNCASPTSTVLGSRHFSFSSRRNTQTQRSSESTLDSTPSSPSGSSATSCSPSERERRSLNQGKRVAQIIKLKPECVEEYKKIHAAVWPEVLKAIRSSGIRDCRFSLLILFSPFHEKRSGGEIRIIYDIHKEKKEKRNKACGSFGPSSRSSSEATPTIYPCCIRISFCELAFREQFLTTCINV